jgi:hypothetical protein
MDKILELLGLSQFIQPKAHDNIDSLMKDNAQQPLASRETSIGPIPQGGLSQQDILEMIMPFGGMGRIAKTGVRAGRGIVDALKRRGRSGTEDKTLEELKKTYKYSEKGQGGDYFKSLLDNLFESFKGKEF